MSDFPSIARPADRPPAMAGQREGLRSGFRGAPVLRRSNDRDTGGRSGRVAEPVASQGQARCGSLDRHDLDNGKVG